ncbi:RICIN domain-containing protein [Streptomyces sp. NBC_00572]|uniref:RICIN domain-containing protein n=1 Tax=Streptomyces sp. NBC_00572 TaxID=2903664 RepID=UPI0022545B99|nr:RICIN domain-containing protein [Streptomyces sp. NBC_00572]MCX4984305.1 RICIN domain-containing protein [Streptomyces sp. NBC_00572]
MRRTPSGTFTVLTTLCAVLFSLLGSLLGPAGTAQAATATVTNATTFTDPAGNPVHAHGGGVVKAGSYYYWFGENRNADNTFRYVSAYRSTDLRTWEFRHHVLTQSTDPELQSANIERPKVMYNAATGQFVMWMHKENATDYGEARAAVAVSSTVDGDYTWLGSFRPLGHMSRDITTFVDTDGAGYMISAANENADLHVYRLTADYTGIASQVQKLWPGQWREAPALFQRGGVYFLLTSGATGWSPNQQKYGTATSVTGTWSGLKDVGDGTTYGSQTAYVLPVQGTSGTSYLYLGDRWGNSMGGNVNDSQYVWLPLRFPTKTTMAMDYFPQITVDTAAGTVKGLGSWETLTAAHSGKCADVADRSTADGGAVIQWSCGGNSVNQQFWLRSTGSGQVQIVARYSGKCLTVSGGSTADGAAVAQYPCDGRAGQRWSAVGASTGVQLVAAHSGKCLDVTNTSTADGTPLVQWTCNTGTNQRWSRTAV